MPNVIPDTRRDALVIPVSDYEPPAFGGPPVPPPPVDARPLRRASMPRVCRSPAEDGQARAAATFADAALRRILEVVDRRRVPAQMRPMMAGGLAESLLAKVGRGEPLQCRAAAQLRRVRAQPVRPDGSAAEVTASYTRGDRVHAIACRVEQIDSRWRVVALHLG